MRASPPPYYPNFYRLLRALHVANSSDLLKRKIESSGSLWYSKLMIQTMLFLVQFILVRFWHSFRMRFLFLSNWLVMKREIALKYTLHNHTALTIHTHETQCSHHSYANDSLLRYFKMSSWHHFLQWYIFYIHKTLVGRERLPLLLILAFTRAATSCPPEQMRGWDCCCSQVCHLKRKQRNVNNTVIVDPSRNDHTRAVSFFLQFSLTGVNILSIYFKSTTVKI